MRVSRHASNSRKRFWKGQSSIEYLFIVAIALLIIVPGTALFYQYSQTSQENIQHSKIYKIGSELVDTGEMIYSVGENSWQTIEVSFPGSVQTVKVYANDTMSELVLSYGDVHPSDAVFFSKNTLLNATGNKSECSDGCKVPIKKGLNSIRIESGTEGEIRYYVMD